MNLYDWLNYEQFREYASSRWATSGVHLNAPIRWGEYLTDPTTKKEYEEVALRVRGCVYRESFPDLPDSPSSARTILRGDLVAVAPTETTATARQLNRNESAASAVSDVSTLLSEDSHWFGLVDSGIAHDAQAWRWRECLVCVSLFWGMVGGRGPRGMVGRTVGVFGETVAGLARETMGEIVSLANHQPPL